jgi:hypothetical protein
MFNALGRRFTPFSKLNAKVGEVIQWVAPSLAQPPLVINDVDELAVTMEWSGTADYMFVPYSNLGLPKIDEVDGNMPVLLLSPRTLGYFAANCHLMRHRGTVFQ